MKLILLALISLAASLSAYGQQTMIVFLKDKGNEQISPLNFSERSLQRRTERQVEFDSYDIPVSHEYLEHLGKDGTVLNVSRWLNAVSFSSLLTVEELESKYDFIKNIRVTSAGKPGTKDKFEVAQEDSKAFAYGAGIAQVHQLNLQCLHNLGYTGSGVYMAIIDAGFENMQQIDYFDTLYNEGRVMDQYNFVAGNTQVYNSSSHGTSVTSCIVAEKGPSGEFAGTAVDVDIALYLTEDVSSETEIEEFNLVTALERSDSVGADIANISLGYVNFDDPSTSHDYADLDGNTTIAAMGVNTAVSKGIAVVMAAGNSGPLTIGTPCDADDGLCVGAVNALGQYAFFSSLGPASDGAVKPNVVARGEQAWVVISSGILDPGNGTSYASPIMAGATACLMQAHPTRTVAEIFEAIEMSADQYDTPSNMRGHGIPDFCAAHDYLTTLSIGDLKQEKIVVFPNPAKDYLTVQTVEKEISVQIFNALGEVVRETDAVNGFAVFNVQELGDGMYLIRSGNITEKVLITR